MRLDSIQGLRALAAYLVVFYHIRSAEFTAGRNFRQTDTSFISDIFGNAYAGVDLFFVISGFIMVYVSASKPENLTTLKDFLLARIFRIYPPWWLFASVMAVYLFLTYGVPWDAVALAEKGNTGLNYVIRSYLLLPQPNSPLLGVGWTLVHEMYFYVAFATLLMAPRRLLPAWLAVWAMVVIAGALSGYANLTATNFLQLIFHPMTLQFICGALAGWLFVSGVRVQPMIVFLTGVVSFILVLWLYPDPTPFTLSWGRVLVYTLPCTLLVYGAAGLQENFKGPVAKILSRLGDYSFSLYLSHIFVLSTLARLSAPVADILQTKLGLSEGLTDLLRLGKPGIADNLFFAAAALIGSTILAALTYHLFEQPALKALNRFRPKQKNRS